MTIVEQLRSFHRRRIAIPVTHNALVLDVGSGDKPSWRADVLLDRYVGAEFGAQRSGAPAARVSRPLFDASAADMPFADGVFDYAICSHVLEHVPDPAAVVAELARVAAAGYIEVPDAASAKIVDFPSHLWWCRLDRSTAPATLMFTAKHAPYFDAEIHRYLTESGLERKITTVLDSRFDHRIVSLHWTDSVAVKVEGEPDPALVESALHAGGHHRAVEGIAARLLTAILTLPARRRRRRVASPIRYDDIVKPEHRRGDGAVLEPRVYRFDGPSRSSMSSQ